MFGTPDRAAAEAPDYAFDGFYLGAAGTWAVYAQLEGILERAAAIVSPIPVHADVQTPVGLDVRFGYRFRPRFAGELQFEWLPAADIRLEGVDALQLETWTLTANVKAYILKRRYQPYLLAGIGVTHFRYEDQLGIDASVDEVNFGVRRRRAGRSRGCRLAVQQLR